MSGEELHPNLVGIGVSCMVKQVYASSCFSALVLTCPGTLPLPSAWVDLAV